MAARFLLAGILHGMVLAFTLGIGVGPGDIGIGPSDTQPGKYQLAAVYDGTEAVVLIRMNTQTGAIDACRRLRVNISDREPTVQLSPLR